MDGTLDLVRLRVEGRRGLRQERSLTHKELLHPLLSLSMWSEDSNQPAQEAAETHDNFSSLRRIPERAGNGKTPTEFHSRYDRGFKLEEQQPDVQQSFSMSLGGTLERGAHHQALDLSEELPLHHSQNHHHQNHLPHHSHSLASPAVVAGRETPSRVVVPPPYCAADGGGSEAAPELRGSLDCWACSVLVTAQNLLIAAINACLAALVFGTILTPATAMVVFGFLCHSTVRPHGTSPYCSDLLNDGGCVALLVVGFLLVTPLLVLALAAYCRLARHLQLALCFIPYSRAVYKNLPASRHRGLGGGCCCGRDEDEGKGKVWV